MQTVNAKDEGLRVLVVDDEPSNVSLIEKILSTAGLKSDGVTSGAEALKKISENDYDAILLDVMMPEMDGYEVCRRLKQNDATRLIPIIIVTALTEKQDRINGIEAGCDDFLSKPFDRLELIARVKALGKSKRLNDDLERAASVVMSLARAVEAKDDTTGRHCDRLIGLSRRFGEYLGLNPDDIKTLERASVMHDVGKIGMPDWILLKPDSLSIAEWDVMKKHPEIGENICRPLTSLRDVCPIIRSHHECWNGSGYPDGLKEEGIPYLARVFQILDAYEALVTERPYKKAYSKEEALQTLKYETQKGHWDPSLMEKFIDFISSRS